MIKELEDYTWFPPLLRRFQMDFIGFTVSCLKVYEELAPVVKQFTEKNNVQAVQDVCSGSGAPALYMHRQTKFTGYTVLSDKFPPHSFNSKENIHYLKKAVDVLDLQVQPGVCYTMYNALHHFSDAQKKQLMRKIQEGKGLFLFAEILKPGIAEMLKILFTTTILQLLLVPFIRPFSLLRIFFTWVLPVNLITVTYDGVVSVFKSSTAAQFRKLCDTIQVHNYHITVSEIKSWKSNMVYITGNPVLQ